MRDGGRLGLGGHSFIQELGNDPQPTFEEQCAIVQACLDAGIRRFDTTYHQERVALGKVLRRLGRRAEAEIMAWNFFKHPGRENELVGYTCYEPEHLSLMLEELQTDRLDLLVIHCHDDGGRLRAELDLAAGWVRAGRVGGVGLGMAQPRHLDLLRAGDPVTHVLAPYNAFHRGAAAMFRQAHALRLRTVALSPFVRGWKLDEIGTGADREAAAGVLLRWVAFQDLVDGVIVSMRRQRWVAANLEAIARGPLSEDEQAAVERWTAP